MDYIKVLKDEDFGLESIEFENPRIRYGARGIIFNSDNKIAILNKKNKNEFKLVGGGIDENEDPTYAFKRESLEECGCEIEIDDFIGLIKEEKSLDNFMQISYVYTAHVINNTHVLNLTQKENDEGAEILWVDLKDAIELIKNSEKNLIASKYENVYHSKFIVRRDYTILKYYLDNKSALQI